MEVSSFALAQNRIGPAKFRLVVFTNLCLSVRKAVSVA